MKKIKLNENFLTTPIAHRGLHSDTVSENSISAYKLAIEKGYPIEIDTHLLKDGRIAVVHDSDLTRVTGKTAIVENLTSEELKNYELKLSHEKIPLLEEILELVDGKVPLLIELKFNDGLNKQHALTVLKILEGYKYKNKVALQTFHPFGVRFLKKHTDDYSVGLLATYDYKKGKFTTNLLKSLKLYYFIHADFMSYDILYLPNKYVSKKRKHGEQLLVWTIRNNELKEKASKIADNIIFEKIEL